MYYQKSSGIRIWRKWKNEIIRQRKFSKKIRTSSKIVKNDIKLTLKSSKSANNLNEYEKKNENKNDKSEYKFENIEDDELNHRKLIKKSFLLVTNYCSYSKVLLRWRRYSKCSRMFHSEVDFHNSERLDLLSIELNNEIIDAKNKKNKENKDIKGNVTDLKFYYLLFIDFSIDRFIDINLIILFIIFMLFYFFIFSFFLFYSCSLFYFLIIVTGTKSRPRTSNIIFSGGDKFVLDDEQRSAMLRSRHCNSSRILTLDSRNRLGGTGGCRGSVL